MKLNQLYLLYGLALAAIGLTGFMLTHAKSALISGLVTGGIMIIVSFVVLKNSTLALVAKLLNFIFLAAFTWRFWLAMGALSAGDSGKLIPSVLLSMMALVSVVVLAISILKPVNDEVNEGG